MGTIAIHRNRLDARIAWLSERCTCGHIRADHTPVGCWHTDYILPAVCCCTKFVSRDRGKNIAGLIFAMFVVGVVAWLFL